MPLRGRHEAVRRRSARPADPPRRFRSVVVTPSSDDAASVKVRLPGGAVIELGDDLRVIERVVGQLLDHQTRHGSRRMLSLIHADEDLRVHARRGYAQGRRRPQRDHSQRVWRGSHRRQLVRVHQSPSRPHEDPALRRRRVLAVLPSAGGRHVRRGPRARDSSCLVIDGTQLAMLLSGVSFSVPSSAKTVFAPRPNKRLECVIGRELSQQTGFRRVVKIVCFFSARRRFGLAQAKKLLRYRHEE